MHDKYEIQRSCCAFLLVLHFFSDSLVLHLPTLADSQLPESGFAQFLLLSHLIRECSKVNNHLET